MFNRGRLIRTAAQTYAAMQNKNLLQPEFVNQVINHIDSLRKKGGCPTSTSIDGMDVLVNMAPLALANIALLHDMHQIRVHYVDGFLYVVLKADVRAFAESYDQLLRSYIDYVAASCQKGLNRVCTIKDYYNQEVECAGLPF